MRKGDQQRYIKITKIEIIFVDTWTTIGYNDISFTFLIMPPGMKLCKQQSFIPSNIRGNIADMVAQMSKHHLH